MTSSKPTFYFELFQIVCCFNQILKKSSMRRLFLPLLVSFCFSVAFAQNFTLKSNDIEGQAQMKQMRIRLWLVSILMPIPFKRRRW